METAGIGKEDRMRRTILASDLALHTGSEIMVEYFTEFGVVENVTYINDRRNDRYTHSCKVRMASLDSVAAILQKARHFINGLVVTVEQYRGLAEHQWLFLEGNCKVKLEGLPLKGFSFDLHGARLYEILQQVFVGCGRYSDIHLMDNRGRLTGVAVVDFIKSGDARRAMKRACKMLNCKAFRIRSRARPEVLM